MWRLRSTTEVDLDDVTPFYWSQIDGWTYKEYADTFMEDEKMDMDILPSGSVWEAA